jgi:hypothetical protein
MKLTKNTTAPAGEVACQALSDLGDLQSRTSPGFRWKLHNFFRSRWHGFGRDMMGRIYGNVSLQPTLYGVKFSTDWTKLPIERAARLRALLAAGVDARTLVSAFDGHVIEYGVLSTRVVTTAGVNFLCDAFQGLATLANMKYHGFGTGTTEEAVGQTALVTELTTQYASDNTRITGTQAEGGTANVYRSVATLSPDTGGTIAVTEHGLFDNATVGSGTLWDRSLFAAVNLVAGSDSLQVTYDLTLTAGG